MSGIFTSSIGKKMFVSLAGIFLIVFLLVHMGVNLLVIIYKDPMVYNKAAHFMSSNIPSFPIVQAQVSPFVLKDGQKGEGGRLGS